MSSAEIGSLADLFDNLVGTGDLRNTSMTSAALCEFHGVAVGVMCAHRSFPWLFMRRLEKINASCFQKLEQLIEMIRGQFNMMPARCSGVIMLDSEFAGSMGKRPIVPPVGPPTRIIAKCGALSISTENPNLSL
jgi:hypothetical protein